MFVNFVIFGMLISIMWAIVIDEGGDYTACINSEFPLFFIKWPLPSRWDLRKLRKNFMPGFMGLRDDLWSGLKT